MFQQGYIEKFKRYFITHKSEYSETETVSWSFYQDKVEQREFIKETFKQQETQRMKDKTNEIQEHTQ